MPTDTHLRYTEQFTALTGNIPKQQQFFREVAYPIYETIQTVLHTKDAVTLETLFDQAGSLIQLVINQPPPSHDYLFISDKLAALQTKHDAATKAFLANPFVRKLAQLEDKIAILYEKIRRTIIQKKSTDELTTLLSEHRTTDSQTFKAALHYYPAVPGKKMLSQMVSEDVHLATYAATLEQFGLDKQYECYYCLFATISQVLENPDNEQAFIHFKTTFSTFSSQPNFLLWLGKSTPRYDAPVILRLIARSPKLSNHLTHFIGPCQPTDPRMVYKHLLDLYHAIHSNDANQCKQVLDNAHSDIRNQVLNPHDIVNIRNTPIMVAALRHGLDSPCLATLMDLGAAPYPHVAYTLKRFGHVMGVQAKYDFFIDRTTHIPIETAAFDSAITATFLPEMIEAFSKQVAGNDPTLKQKLRIIYEDFKASTDIIYQHTDRLQQGHQLVQRLNQKKTLYLLSGTKKHVVVVSAKNKHIYLINRGEGAEKLPGVLVYRQLNPLTAELIIQLIQATGYCDILRYLAGYSEPINYIPCKPHGPFCAFSNLKTAITIELEPRYQKLWTNFTRNHSLEQALAVRHQPFFNKQHNNLCLSAFRSLLMQHHGEIDISKPYEYSLQHQQEPQLLASSSDFESIVSYEDYISNSKKQTLLAQKSPKKLTKRSTEKARSEAQRGIKLLTTLTNTELSFVLDFSAEPYANITQLVTLWLYLKQHLHARHWEKVTFPKLGLAHLDPIIGDAIDIKEPQQAIEIIKDFTGIDIKRLSDATLQQELYGLAVSSHKHNRGALLLTEILKRPTLGRQATFLHQRRQRDNRNILDNAIQCMSENTRLVNSLLQAGVELTTSTYTSSFGPPFNPARKVKQQALNDARTKNDLTLLISLLQANSQSATHIDNNFLDSAYAQAIDNKSPVLLQAILKFIELHPTANQTWLTRGKQQHMLTIITQPHDSHSAVQAALYVCDHLPNIYIGTKHDVKAKLTTQLTRLKQTTDTLYNTLFAPIPSGTSHAPEPSVSTNVAAMGISPP